MRKVAAALFFFLLFGLLLSCSTIDCPTQTNVMVRYGFYDAAGRVDTLRDTLSIWSKRKNGTDTLLLNRGVNKTALELYISYQHPEDVLFFSVTDTNKVVTLDTVWVKKDDIPHFESVDCAAHFFHTLTAVRSSHHLIDTIAIVNPTVNYDTSGQHLHIRFKAHR